MYDKISLSVLHRTQWLAAALETLPKLVGRRNDTNVDRKMIDEVRPRMIQIIHAAHSCEHYFVEDHFRQLTEFATATIPLDFVFDESMLITPSGWMEVENGILPPGRNPDLDRLNILIWFRPTEGDSRYQFKFLSLVPVWTQPGFVASDKPDNMLWSDFGMYPGETLGSLLERVPAAEGYAQFALCLLHLMSQRMTVTPTANVRANVISKARASGMCTTVKPRLVMLRRRMPDDHVPVAREDEHREYNWQWMVRGHWRQQYYPSLRVTRPLFIEAYIKGPENMPLKPLTSNIFVARR